MHRKHYRNAFVCLSVIAVCAWLAPQALAVVTSKWQVAKYAEWNKGEGDSALISSLGEVRPGWKTERVELEVDGVWAMAAAKNGTTYLGTDDKGTIYKVAGKKATKLASIPDTIAVVSLSLTTNGTLYAGTMPGGQIWRVNTSNGKAEKLATLSGAETVWSLAQGRAGKKLYAGTGPKGKLFEIDAKSGSSKVVFESDDKRILSLAATDDGAIWMGTSSKALVFRYDPARGTTRAMGDFAGNEVTAIAADGRDVIVSANDLKEPATSGSKTKAAVDKAKKKPAKGQKAKMPKKGTKPGAEAAAPAGATAPRKGGRKGKGSLFRVRSDGQLRQLHALTSTYYTSIVVTDDGRIFAGAADKGRIYLVERDEGVATAFDVKERSIERLSYDAKRGLSFSTGDAAAFYRSSGRASSATYKSKAFDTKAPARFGKISWRSAGAVKIETRSGNTSEPGKGWSGWQPPKSVGGAGGGAKKGQVTSPPGRYIQFRASFGGGSADVLRQVELFYLPQNKATRVSEFKIAESTNHGTTLQTAAAKPRSPVLKLSWDIENDDGDATEYELSVRREGEARWRAIVTGNKPITKTEYEWNTETFPDGYYRLRVTASDRRENSADRALVYEKTTELFLVDNNKPTVSGISVRYPAVSARATDSMSTISEMAFSVDDGPWHLGSSGDRLFDDVSELLRIKLPADLAPGVHTLAIRVADAAGNIGSASVTFRVR